MYFEIAQGEGSGVYACWKDFLKEFRSKQNYFLILI